MPKRGEKGKGRKRREVGGVVFEGERRKRKEGRVGGREGRRD